MKYASIQSLIDTATRRPYVKLALLSSIALSLGCSKADQSSPDTSATASASDTAQVPDSSARPTSVRGRIMVATDTLITVSTPNGDVSVKIEQPLAVYSRVPAKLSQVTANSFVGVTSAKQPDGSMRASEIHIFPDALRGTGEGSYAMGRRGGNGGGGNAGGGNAGGGNAGGGNTMTNGTVTGSTMTNGTISGGTMTNGTVRANLGGALTIKFKADSQTITIPPDVIVMAIAPTKTKLAPGTSVVIPVKKQPDGTLTSSTVMLSPPRTRPD